ncbi:hypothetical protein [Blastococcus sp. CT_GayMR16]|uniref:LGFP repeat-containing protein n=1 Tax=Blastococcus sp. CT_GayMR16 TaxID=2559607 RepID=UPI001073D78F|nr:hypothetical protein [Blastococcus sp. CT_GayMR16]TFV83442.1 hypothetical protein E4P38_19980 [Blastococcus sp. CT_GayMR16]
MADVIGAIRDKWLALGGNSFTGPALDVERPTFDGVGRAQPFRDGVIISWHPQLGAFEVHGAIGEKWQQMGREQFGYPVTDETTTPDRRGRFNHFRSMQIVGDPVASIYWTPETGAHEVRGAIRSAWERSGFERGPLGYPMSDEFGDAAHRRSNFEHGFIDWTPQRGAQVHGPVRID